MVTSESAQWHKHSAIIFFKPSLRVGSRFGAHVRKAKRGFPSHRIAYGIVFLPLAHKAQRCDCSKVILCHTAVWGSSDTFGRLSQTTRKKKLIMIRQSNDSTSNRKQRDIEIALAFRHLAIQTMFWPWKPRYLCRPRQETVTRTSFVNIPNGLISKLPCFSFFALSTSSSPSSSSTWQDQNIMSWNHVFNTI